MFTTLAILGGVCAYLQIGRFFSRKAKNTWLKEKRSLSSALFFPITHLSDKIGNVGIYWNPPITEFRSERLYMVLSSLIWPLRFVSPTLAWSGFVLYKVVLRPLARCGLVLCKIGYKVGLFLFEPEMTMGCGKHVKAFMAGFRTRLEERKQRRLVALPEKAVEDQLPPMKEELNGLLAEKEVIDNKIIEAQERICAEEARRMGTYREAPKLTG